MAGPVIMWWPTRGLFTWQWWGSQKESASVQGLLRPGLGMGAWPFLPFSIGHADQPWYNGENHTRVSIRRQGSLGQSWRMATALKVPIVHLLNSQKERQHNPLYFIWLLPPYYSVGKGVNFAACILTSSICIPFP